MEVAWRGQAMPVTATPEPPPLRTSRRTRVLRWQPGASQGESA